MNGREELAHAEYIRNLPEALAVPCYRRSMTRDGRCLNCGYVPQLLRGPLARSLRSPSQRTFRAPERGNKQK